MTAGMRVLIAGCGYLGTAAARVLAARGHEVFAARRLEVAPPSSVQAVAVDLLRGSLTVLPPRLDAVVWAVAPQDRTAAAYRAAYRLGPQRLLSFLQQRGDRLRRSILVSSTRVWEHRDGSIVDEDTATLATTPPAVELVLGEAEFLAAAPGPVALRLGGIYGPGRTALLERVRGGLAVPPPSTRHQNRIHRDDGAEAIAHVLALPAPQSCYIVVDDDPADERDVLAFLAERLGTELPPPDPLAQRQGGKRCRNDRLRRSGWRPRHPSYRHGYGAMLAGPSQGTA